MAATTMGVLRAHNDGTISQRPQNIIIALKSAEEDAAEWETYSVTMPAGIIKTDIDESHVLHDNTEYIDMKTASLKDMEPIQTRNTAGSREARYLHKDIIPFLNKMKVFPSFNGANTNFGKRLLFMYNTLTEVLIGILCLIPFLNDFIDSFEKRRESAIDISFLKLLE